MWIARFQFRANLNRRVDRLNHRFGIQVAWWSFANLLPLILKFYPLNL